jgi:hypothetical protein
MSEDAIHESEQLLFQALKPYFLNVKRCEIVAFERFIDSLVEDYQARMGILLVHARNPLTYLYLIEKRLMQFRFSDYTSPVATYDAMAIAGLEVSDIDNFCRDWRHCFVALEDDNGQFRLHPFSRRRLAHYDEADIQFMAEQVFPFVARLLTEQLEDSAQTHFNDQTDKLQTLFCSSYQWRTVGRVIEFVQETIAIQQRLSGGGRTEGKSAAVSKRLHNFGYRLSDPQPLALMCRELNRRFDFFVEMLTSPQDFADLLSTRNMDELATTVHFACETTQVAYILTAIQPFFEHLSFQNIERSGRFFTHQGKPLTANNLSKSKSDNPKEKDYIDRVLREIFNKFW